MGKKCVDKLLRFRESISTEVFEAFKRSYALEKVNKPSFVSILHLIKVKCVMAELLGSKASRRSWHNEWEQ